MNLSTINTMTMDPSTVSSPRRGVFLLRLILLVLFVVGAIYGYIWYQQTSQLRGEYEAVIEKAAQYDVLNTEVKKEYDRCQDFMAQGAGSFSGLEYCKEFTLWYKGAIRK
jgi:cell division protein FtsB